MVLDEDHECGVCYERYTRGKHIPRMLFCKHTFCGPCLKTIAIDRSNMLCIRCPMCRQVSCVDHALPLEQALWVNSRLWDCISEGQEMEVWEENLDKVCKEEKRKSAIAVFSLQLCCRFTLLPQHDRIRLRLPGFLRRLTAPRQSQERIVPGCNVRGKLWRRLSGEEMA